ncbi:JINGUBANG-like protein [Drosera capensis]
MSKAASSSSIVPMETAAPPLRPSVKFAQLLRLSEPDVLTPTTAQLDTDDDEGNASPDSNPSATSSPRLSNAESSSMPFVMSPWTHSSPYVKSPWIKLSPQQPYNQDLNGLIATLLREEGHVYSLAASGDMLFTGSDARNIGVWKDLKDFGGFKSNAGLVKAIVVSGDSNASKIFTGHQDGKIRVWKVSVDNPAGHKRIGTLPTFKDYLKSSMNPKSYVQARRHRKVPKVKHFDAVSCLGLNQEAGILYSGSWDKTIKVWRLSDSKCLESIDAHDDAINSVIVGIDGMVFSGSADGTVKAWRRELQGRSTKHFLVQTLLAQQNAVTALAANAESGILYSGSSEGLVNFWEGDGMLSYGGVLRGHKLAVLCLATAGTLLFSGSADKSICVWKLESYGVHMCLAVLTGHSGPVKCLAVDVDNQTEEDGYREGRGNDYGANSWIVYSGSLDKSVKVWRVRT